jgi:hypothetical protein
MNTDEQQVVSSDRPVLNESAIREHALLCSKTYRAGKFTRVGSEFIEEVFTDAEVIMRELRAKFNTLHPALQPAGNFVKGAYIDKFQEELDKAIGRMIQNKTQRHPSVGVTLMRTR